ncbi:MAG: DUF481 domain-containing protein [Gemmatimonadetes bacterium]|nr:DUF481 domain-containing protein [Gemmatimonadota bacterium]
MIKFTGDLGYVSTAGNSSVQTLNLGDRVSAKFGVVTISQQFSLVHGRSKGKTVTSLYRAQLRSGLLTADHLRHLRPGQLRAQRLRRPRVPHRDQHRVDGVAPRRPASPPHARGRRLGDGTALGRPRQAPQPGLPRWARGDGLYPEARRQASFAQTIELLPNFREKEDLRINTESTVVAPITKEVGVKLSYVIRYDGLPQPGFLSTDRLFTSGIQITL